MNTNSTSQSIAAAVSEMLTEAGVSRLAAAEATGIPRATLLRRLSGATAFNTSEMAALATLLGTTVSAIVLRAEQEAA